MHMVKAQCSERTQQKQFIIQNCFKHDTRYSQIAEDFKFLTVISKVTEEVGGFKAILSYRVF